MTNEEKEKCSTALQFIREQTERMQRLLYTLQEVNSHLAVAGGILSKVLEVPLNQQEGYRPLSLNAKVEEIK